MTKQARKTVIDVRRLDESNWIQAFKAVKNGKATLGNTRDDVFGTPPSRRDLTEVDFDRRIRGVQCLSFLESGRVLVVASREIEMNRNPDDALRRRLEQMTGTTFRGARRFFADVKYRLQGAGAGEEKLNWFDGLTAVLQTKARKTLVPEQTLPCRRNNRPRNAGVGRAHIWESVPKVHESETDIEAEVARLDELTQTAADEWRRLTGTRMPTETLQLWQMPYLLLQDKTDEGIIATAIRICTRDHKNAEWALTEAAKECAKAYAGAKRYNIGDDLRQAAGIGNMLLSGKTPAQLARDTIETFKSPTVVMASTLDPETAQLLCENKNVVGIVVDNMQALERHLPIICRNAGVMLLSIQRKKMRDIQTGDWVALDTFSEKPRVIAHPTEATKKEFSELEARVKTEEDTKRSEAKYKAKTTDGALVIVAQNADTPTEVTAGRLIGGCDVGLSRTEFHLMTNQRVPSVNELAGYYRGILDMANGREVVFRFWNWAEGKNIPCIEDRTKDRVGWTDCGVKFLLDNPDLVALQTKAFLNAGARNWLIPFVETQSEVRRMKEIALQAAREMSAEEQFKMGVNWGAMIETPLGVTNTEAIAAEVGFLSCGGNDMTMHTIPGMHGKSFDVSRHPYDPRAIAQVKTLADKVGRIWGPDDVYKNGFARQSFCGDAASEPEYYVLLLGLGYRKVSVDVGFVPLARRITRALSIATAQKVAAAALKGTSIADVKARIRQACPIDLTSDEYTL